MSTSCRTPVAGAVTSTTLLRSDALRAIEQTHADQPLMERAGAAGAALAARLIGASRAPALILAGPGNNGGDAFVVARRLHDQHLAVVVVFQGDIERLPADARAAFEQLRACGIDVQRTVPEGEYSLVVDGLFGIGLQRPITGPYQALIERVNAFHGPILALDVPSGLDADTGAIHGIAVRATHTATFIAAKPGLYTLHGPDHAGEISIHDLQIAATGSPGSLLAVGDFRHALQPRRRNSHKGSLGSLAVIGGAPGMTGAALLAGRAALNLGAGRVYVGLLEPLRVDPVQPELMLRTPDQAIAHATAVVAGPGLGLSDAAADIVRRLASADFPLLLDADALNVLAEHPVLARGLRCRATPAVLTPHPAEAARLLKSSVEQVQADRIASALELACRFKACVALKGCGTVLAQPDGSWQINTTGNPGLATGGTGDVLAGFAGALLAQGWAPQAALDAAVHLHGQAADDYVSYGHGPIGFTASELIPAARHRFNRWIADNEH